MPRPAKSNLISATSHPKVVFEYIATELDLH